LTAEKSQLIMTANKEEETSKHRVISRVNNVVWQNNIEQKTNKQH